MIDQTLSEIRADPDLAQGTPRAIRTVLDSIVAFVGVLTPDGILREANEPALAAAGLGRDDVIGQYFWDCYWWNFDPEVQDRLRDAVASAAAGQDVRYDAEIRVADNQQMFIDFQLRPHFAADGTVNFLIPSGFDITDRKRKERHLRATGDGFARMVTSSPFGIYTVDADFRLSMISLGAQKVFSSVKPAIGRDFAEILRILWPEPFASEAIGLFRKTLETGEPYHSPKTVENRNDIGETEAYDWKIERVVLPDGRPGVVCHFYDLSEREEHEAALRQSEERFRSIFENAAVGIAHVGLDGSFSRINRRLCDILGYSHEELCQKRFQDLTHPDDLPGDLEHLTRLRDGKEDLYQTRKRYIRKDGSIVWTQLTVNCVRSEDGQPQYFISIVEDITAEKAAEARQELLIGELNHRVKNSLASIQAMASHTMRSSEDMNEFREAFGGRLRAMAAAHESIFTGSELHADLADLVKRQLAPYAAEAGDRLALDGPPLQLDPQLVHALGLVFHELATNASKYGALSGPDGKIHVSWGAKEHDGTIRLLWAESGGPRVKPADKTGFGSALINLTLEESLGGKVAFDFRPEGLGVEMSFPAKGPT